MHDQLVHLVTFRFWQFKLAVSIFLLAVKLDIHETLRVISVEFKNGDGCTELQFEKKPFTDYGSVLFVKVIYIQRNPQSSHFSHF